MNQIQSIEQLPQAEHHTGPPITALDAVRNRYNVVAAVSNVESARELIVALEDAGIAPAHISLLGAWPADQEPSPPYQLYKDAMWSGATCASAGITATALLKRRPPRWLLLAGGLMAGIGGVIVSLARNTGESEAWNQTLIADGSGNAAVGVHSTDKLEVVTAEKVMLEVGVLNLSRFEGRLR